MNKIGTNIGPNTDGIVLEYSRGLYKIAKVIAGADGPAYHKVLSFKKSDAEVKIPGRVLASLVEGKVQWKEKKPMIEPEGRELSAAELRERLQTARRVMNPPSMPIGRSTSGRAETTDLPPRPSSSYRIYDGEDVTAPPRTR